MKCRVCGSELQQIITSLPFKTDEDSIVIVKSLPVVQCSNCQEYLIEDTVMMRVEIILEQVGQAAELEVVRYAA